jgi:HPt (histidine-containing phosphotransfer) domain-containing protein
VCPSEPINSAAFDAFVKTLGNDADFLAELIDDYARDASELVTSMHAAVAARQPAEVARLAHSLKSTSASLCAARLPMLCQDVEAQARAGAVDGLSEQLTTLEVELTRVEQALRALARSL